jgi:hypothetical protein
MPGTMQTRLNRAHRDFEHSSHFLVGNVLEVAQKDHGSIVVGQAIERALHGFTDLLSFHGFSRAGLGITNGFSIIDGNIALVSSIHALTPRGGMVQRDSVEPGGKVGIATELSDSPVS